MGSSSKPKAKRRKRRNGLFLDAYSKTGIISAPKADDPEDVVDERSRLRNIRNHVILDLLNGRYKPGLGRRDPLPKLSMPQVARMFELTLGKVRKARDEAESDRDEIIEAKLDFSDRP